MELKEYMMSVDAYLKEAKLTNYTAFVYQALNIITNNPGFIPEYPHIGIGLQQNYSHRLEDDPVFKTEIKDKIATQLMELFPDITLAVTTTIKQLASGIKYLYLELKITNIDMTLAIDVVEGQDIKVSVTYKDYNA